MKTRKTTKGAHRRSVQRSVIPLVCCKQCKGMGQVPLSDEMFATLDTVKWLEESHAEEVAEQLHWNGHVTAMNNRLKELMRLGFLKRAKDGKLWMYRAV